MTPPVDPRVAVGRSLRTLVVRRLGRAFVPLALLAVLGVVAGLLGAVPWATAVAQVLGAPVSAAAVLLLGQSAVRRGFGVASSGPWRLAGLARVVPWAWGSWVLVVPAVGAGREALAREAWAALAVAAATGVLAGRVLLDGLAVARLGRLAETMTADLPPGGTAS